MFFTFSACFRRGRATQRQPFLILLELVIVGLIFNEFSDYEIIFQKKNSKNLSSTSNHPEVVSLAEQQYTSGDDEESGNVEDMLDKINPVVTEKLSESDDGHKDESDSNTHSKNIKNVEHHVKSWSEEGDGLAIQDENEHLQEPEECPVDIGVYDSKSKSLPRDTKFVFPILKWGPNNQILGFYEAMHLANYLNRSIVLPVFHLHDTDRASNASYQYDAVPGELRVNAPAIPNLVTMGDFNHFCHHEVSAVYLPTDVFNSGIFGRIIAWEKMTNISILDPEKKYRGFKNHIIQYPPIKEIRAHGDEGDNFIRKNWTEIFKHSHERCAVFALPYRLVTKIPKWAQINDKNVYDYPKIIRSIKKEFAAKFIGIKLGVHWRWSRSDWGGRCYRSKTIPQECHMIHHLNYTKLAKNLLEKSNGGNVYVASPISQWPTMDKISKAASLFSDHQQIYYGADLTKFLQEKYSKCGWYNHWKGEIISMVEQAVCSDAWEFYGWPVSSWSSRIWKVRKMFEIGDPKHGSKKYNTLVLLKESLEDGFGISGKYDKEDAKSKKEKTSDGSKTKKPDSVFEISMNELNKGGRKVDY